MKLYNITDLNGFLNEVRLCKGNVELVSKYGDKLCLKSKLTQYIAFNRLMFEADAFIKELEIVIENPEDLERLSKYSTKVEL